MNEYLELKKRQQKEINTLPIKFAFNKEQFKRGMHELGLKEDDYDKIYKLGSTGGFYRRTDSKLILDTFKRHHSELEEGMKKEEFAYQAFRYELNNHEFSYTCDDTDALAALNVERQDLETNEVLRNALERAKQEIWDQM